MTLADLSRSGFFALYVGWLTTFPMAGPLLGETHLLTWFLLPHVVVLLGSAAFAGAASFRALIPAAVALSAFGTLAYAWWDGEASRYILLLIGVASAPVSIYMGMLLIGTLRPVVTATLGLVAGNLVAVSFVALPLSDDVKLVILALMLFVFTVGPAPQEVSMKGPVHGLFTYLPFIFFFQVLSGLMYSVLYPAYAEQGTFAGIEWSLYMAGALAGLGLIRRRSDFGLLAGVVIAILGLAAWQLLAPSLGVTVGIFALLFAAGIIDVFLLAHVLSFKNQLKAYGYGVGVLCAGIVAGNWLAQAFPGVGEAVAFFGLVLLNVAVIALYLARPQRPVPSLSMKDDRLGTGLPEAFADRCSEQERLVLAQVLQGRTYREVANALAISESSVKTYMQRIYRKMGVVRQSQLLKLIRGDKVGPG